MYGLLIGRTVYLTFRARHPQAPLSMICKTYPRYEPLSLHRCCTQLPTPSHVQKTLLPCMLLSPWCLQGQVRKVLKALSKEHVFSEGALAEFETILATSAPAANHAEPQHIDGVAPADPDLHDSYRCGTRPLFMHIAAATAVDMKLPGLMQLTCKV